MARPEASEATGACLVRQRLTRWEHFSVRQYGFLSRLPLYSISADAAATRLGICIGSLHKLIRKGVLPAVQLMQSAPWQIPVAALDTEVVKTGVREIVGRRPKFYQRFQQDRTLWLPGL